MNYYKFHSMLNLKNRRIHFLINKPLQLRYMAYFIGTLFIVCSIIIASLYFGIWGGILDAFSNEKVRNDLLIATRLAEYEVARTPSKAPVGLSFFQQAQKMSKRQQEIFKEILDDTNKKIIPQLGILFFLIGWGSIYLSHKIAGPLYRLDTSLHDLEKGDLKTRINLRETDEAQFLGARFNTTVENLDFVFSRIKNIVSENDANPDRMRSRLKEELAKIKTSSDRET